MENAVPLTGQDELPEGFTAVDPNSSSGGSSNPSKGGEEEAKELQRKAILEQAMTPEALARLSRIKLVKAEKAKRVETMIVSMALQRKLTARLTEGKLIEMLEGLVGAQASTGNTSINIQRKRYAFDDDDDDDNDDDLL